jgi:hypothetical protein
MVYFQIKNPNLGKFLRALDWKMLIILWPFGTFYGHFGYFMTIWYISSGFGFMHQEKSGLTGFEPGSFCFLTGCDGHFQGILYILEMAVRFLKKSKRQHLFRPVVPSVTSCRPADPYSSYLITNVHTYR